MTLEYRMYLKFLPNPRCLGCFKTSQRSVVEFFERQFHSEKLSSVHKKETEHSIELSLSICVFYRRILKCKTLVLKTTTWSTRASLLVDGWHLLSYQIRFIPHPLNGWHDHWTFVGEGGMGDFEVIIFSQTSGVRHFFPPHIAVEDFFFSILRHWWGIFFSVCILFSLEITHKTTQKSNSELFAQSEIQRESKARKS